MYECGICGREGEEFPHVLQCGVCFVLLCDRHYFYDACELHFNDLTAEDREAIKEIHESAHAGPRLHSSINASF
ncbi:MAG: hypothetical protein ACTSUE_21410 [Promethearchaeota archaeon]